MGLYTSRFGHGDASSRGKYVGSVGHVHEFDRRVVWCPVGVSYCCPTSVTEPSTRSVKLPSTFGAPGRFLQTCFAFE